MPIRPSTVPDVGALAISTVKPQTAAWGLVLLQVYNAH